MKDGYKVYVPPQSLNHQPQGCWVKQRKIWLTQSGTVPGQPNTQAHRQDIFIFRDDHPPPSICQSARSESKLCQHRWLSKAPCATPWLIETPPQVTWTDRWWCRQWTDRLKWKQPIRLGIRELDQGILKLHPRHDQPRKPYFLDVVQRRECRRGNL